MEASSRRDYAISIALVLVALLARWHALGGDYYGDEAWYVYLARTWGTDATAIVGGPDPRPHLLYRPVFYATYHLAAAMGLTAARVFTIGIGVSLVPLTNKLAERLGASRYLSYVAGGVVALHPNLIRFNALAFPDTLASAFLVAAGLGYTQRRHLCAPFFLLLAVLSKESTIPYAIAFAAMAASRRDGVMRAALFLLPCIYVAGVVLFTTQVMGARTQGWSSEPLTNVFFRHLVAAPPLLPFAVALLVTRRWDPLILWVTGPLFYAVWGLGLGKGVAVWYAVAPAPLASAALAVGIPTFAGYLRSKTAIASYATAHRRLAIGLVFAVGCALLPALVREVRANYRKLDGNKRSNTLANAAAFIQLWRPRDISFVNCHFAYAYEPLRTQDSKGVLTNVTDAGQVSASADLIVWCNREGGPIVPEALRTCALLQQPEIAIYSGAECGGGKD